METRHRAATVLDAVARHFDLTDSQLGARAGQSRQAAQARRTGITPMSLNDFDAYGAGLNVPPSLFLMEKDEAIRWIIDNGVTLGVQAPRCIESPLAA